MVKGCLKGSILFNIDICLNVSLPIMPIDGYLEPFLCRSIFLVPDHFDITKFSCTCKKTSDTFLKMRWISSIWIEQLKEGSLSVHSLLATYLNLFWNGFCRHLLSTFDLMYRQRICPTIWYWRFVLQKGGNYLQSFCTTFFGPIRRLNLYMYSWLCAHAMFDVTCLTAFVGASNVIWANCLFIADNAHMHCLTRCFPTYVHALKCHIKCSVDSLISF